MAVLVINSMDENKYQELRKEGKILSTEINIVDDDKINSTDVPSYDVLMNKTHPLSGLSYDDNTTVGQIISDIATKLGANALF